MRYDITLIDKLFESSTLNGMVIKWLYNLGQLLKFFLENTMLHSFEARGSVHILCSRQTHPETAVNSCSVWCREGLQKAH